MFKQEIQGSNGLVREYKDKLIPKGEELARRAMANLGIEPGKLTAKNCRTNFNSLLFSGLVKEHRLYLSLEGELYQTIFRDLINPDETTRKKYPDTVQMVTEITKAIMTSRDASATGLYIMERMVDFIPAIEQSLGQGRSSRAGGSLQNHLANLFRISGFVFETQTKLNGPVDFLFPGMEYFKRNKHDAIILSAKRTLRERWKQDADSLNKAGIGRIYLATTEGVVSPDLSFYPLPGAKIEEMYASNVILVVHDQIKREYHCEDPNVIGYTELANEVLPDAERKWTKRALN